MLKRILGKIISKDKDKRLENITKLIQKRYRIQDIGGEKNIIIEDDPNIIITAHYDNFPGSLGINDNMSSIVSILSVQHKIPYTIVFTDNEEFGGTGLRQYLYHNPIPKLAINLDATGIGNINYYQYFGQFPKLKIKGIELKNTAFSDAYITYKFGIPTLLISAGYKKWGKENFMRRIWSYQHNNVYDNDIKYISNRMLKKTAKTLLKVLKQIR